jgi:multidrug efflux pump
MAQFFIDRPIFAWVIALFILVLGGVAITQLPVRSTRRWRRRPS